MLLSVTVTRSRLWFLFCQSKNRGQRSRGGHLPIQYPSIYPSKKNKKVVKKQPITLNIWWIMYIFFRCQRWVFLFPSCSEGLHWLSIDNTLVSAERLILKNIILVRRVLCYMHNKMLMATNDTHFPQSKM